MINKQSIWFTFLFSIILVLSIFYVSMGESDISKFTADVSTTDTSLVINESTELVALRIQNDEEMLETINGLQEIILDSSSDLDTKNEAYEELLMLNSNKSVEQKLEKIIMDEFNFESFVKLNGINVTVVIDNEKHDYKIANDIISRLSKEFKDNKYITVKFN